MESGGSEEASAECSASGDHVSLRHLPVDTGLSSGVWTCYASSVQR
ncbi:hypothetical protein PI125_g4649 [Phytophthora idaei]|nr:hypothetical protein PI125_g4649 [Phytophthora idaei]